MKIPPAAKEVVTETALQWRLYLPGLHEPRPRAMSNGAFGGVWGKLLQALAE